MQLQRGQGSQGYGQPADVWAVGVAAYEVLVGAGPFEAPSKQATYDKILTAQPSLPSHLSAAARDFISQVCDCMKLHCAWEELHMLMARGELQCNDDVTQAVPPCLTMQRAVAHAVSCAGPEQGASCTTYGTAAQQACLACACAGI